MYFEILTLTITCCVKVTWFKIANAINCLLKNTKGFNADVIEDVNGTYVKWNLVLPKYIIHEILIVKWLWSTNSKFKLFSTHINCLMAKNYGTELVMPQWHHIKKTESDANYFKTIIQMRWWNRRGVFIWWCDQKSVFIRFQAYILITKNFVPSVSTTWLLICISLDNFEVFVNQYSFCVVFVRELDSWFLLLHDNELMCVYFEVDEEYFE